jgi:aminopeptidase N
MDVGDPLTEAVCWTAAWQMVTSGDLAAADLAGLIMRRLGDVPDLQDLRDLRDRQEVQDRSDLPLAGIKVLLERAIECADVYAPSPARALIRERLAGVTCQLTGQAAAGSPHQQALAAGFAASAHSQPQLDMLRSWLAGDLLPDGLDVTADLRGRILFTLSARGLATDRELDTLVARDPVRGQQNRATCSAMRPDPAAKEAAWNLALATDQSLRMAEAHARGLWVPGQEDIMAGYRDRYFAQALPALASREPRVARSLAGLLYPATLVSADTLAATEAGLDAREYSRSLRLLVREREAILRSALAAREARPRPGLAL